MNIIKVKTASDDSRSGRSLACQALDLYMERLEPGKSIDLAGPCMERPDLAEDLEQLRLRWNDHLASCEEMGGEKAAAVQSGAASAGSTPSAENQGTVSRVMTQPSARAPRMNRYKTLEEVARGGMEHVEASVLHTLATFYQDRGRYEDRPELYVGQSPRGDIISPYFPNVSPES